MAEQFSKRFWFRVDLFPVSRRTGRTPEKAFLSTHVLAHDAGEAERVGMAIMSKALDPAIHRDAIVNVHQVG